MDDGGCYLCSDNPDNPSLSYSGKALSMHCRRMCDADPDCVSYSVARPASLPAQEYYYGKIANCCLERREWPAAVWVDAQRPVGEKRNACENESMCWARYERKKGAEGLLTPAQQKCDGGVAAATTPSQWCTQVWKRSDYTDEDLKGKIDFIAQGCDYNDTTFERMLARAHDQCVDEIFAESASATIIVHPRGMLTHINMLGSDVEDIK